MSALVSNDKFFIIFIVIVIIIIILRLVFTSALLIPAVP